MLVFLTDSNLIDTIERCVITDVPWHIKEGCTLKEFLALANIGGHRFVLVNQKLIGGDIRFKDGDRIKALPTLWGG